MSDNCNNVLFTSVRLICSPCLAVKSAVASLRLKIVDLLGEGDAKYLLSSNFY